MMMVKCTLFTITIPNENVNDTNIKVMNGLVEMGTAVFDNSGQSTY